MTKDKLSEGKYLTDMTKIMDDVNKSSNTCANIDASNIQNQ